jgi:hypothetical protein
MKRNRCTHTSVWVFCWSADEASLGPIPIALATFDLIVSKGLLVHICE